jgi:hypothetical protein
VLTHVFFAIATGCPESEGVVSFEFLLEAFEPSTPHSEEDKVTESFVSTLDDETKQLFAYKLKQYKEFREAARSSVGNNLPYAYNFDGNCPTPMTSDSKLVTTPCNKT